MIKNSLGKMGGLLDELKITGSVATNTSSQTTLATLTLTEGDWIVGGSVTHDPGGSTTGMSGTLKAKGSGGTTVGYDLMGALQNTSTYGCITFPPRKITISSSDSNKTIEITGRAVGGIGTGTGYIYAYKTK